MSIVTVTSTIGTTCNYWFTPQAIVDVSGSGQGVVLPDIVQGWIYESADNTPVVLTLQLDNAYLWDVNMTFAGAAPIVFGTFAPGSGGDLLTLLSAQGWVPL